MSSDEVKETHLQWLQDNPHLMALVPTVWSKAILRTLMTWWADTGKPLLLWLIVTVVGVGAWTWIQDEEKLDRGAIFMRGIVVGFIALIVLIAIESLSDKHTSR